MFPHADGKFAGAHRAQAEGLRRNSFIEESVRGQRAEVAHFDPVPIDLVGVVDGGNQEGQVGRRAGRGRNADRTPIPGEAGIAGMALRTPALLGGELLPTGIVESGVGPRGVVAEMELPRAVDGG